MSDGSKRRISPGELESLQVLFPGTDLEHGVRAAWGHHRRIQPAERPRDLEACLIAWLTRQRSSGQARRATQQRSPAPAAPKKSAVAECEIWRGAPVPKTQEEADRMLAEMKRNAK